MVRLDPPRWQVKRRTLLVTAFGCLAVAASAASSDRRPLVVNLSSSVPVGLYLRSARPPQTGDFVLVRLPAHLRLFAARRGYLPRNRLLLKSVAASTGDLVCRLGSRVWVGGHTEVWALRTDSLGRPLPNWRGCRRLQLDEVFLLGSHSNSLDSRYFGPVDRQSVLSTVRPILAFRS